MEELKDGQRVNGFGEVVEEDANGKWVPVDSEKQNEAGTPDAGEPEPEEVPNPVPSPTEKDTK